MKSVDGLLEEHGQSETEVYLDWENGSVIDPIVWEEMKPYYLEKGFANPSITHRIGWETYEFYMKAKETLAQPLKIPPQNLHITTGITESNNLVIRGIAQANKKRKKIILSEVEHLSLLHSARILKNQGYIIDYVPVSNDGSINTDILQEKIDNETLLVSIQSVNHEIGTIQPVKECLEIVKDKDENILFHTDATSAFGRLPLQFDKLAVDLATIESNKILGPKGIGALYVKEDVKIKHVYEGQLSVEVLSPNVENMPLLVGFAKAVEIQFSKFEETNRSILELRDELIYTLQTTIPKTMINGAEGNRRVSDNANISFLGCEGEALTVECSMNGIYSSSGSACTSRVLMPSHILTAIGRKPEEAHGSLLMKINRLNTKKQIRYVIETMPKVVQRIRSITGGIEF